MNIEEHLLTMPKERPILFSGSMVRAILEDRKSQTRRVIKPQPVSEGIKSFGESWKWNEGGKDWFSGVTAAQLANPNYGLIKSLPCPYGVPGDRLWVRETFCVPVWAGGEPKAIWYRATDEAEKVSNQLKWQPSIFMPRWASRITLEITDVRVERLQEISQLDAMAEGLQGKHSFAAGWDEINGKRAPWASNPWVWVISFKKV